MQTPGRTQRMERIIVFVCFPASHSIDSGAWREWEHFHFCSLVGLLGADPEAVASGPSFYRKSPFLTPQP